MFISNLNIYCLHCHCQLNDYQSWLWNGSPTPKAAVTIALVHNVNVDDDCCNLQHRNNSSAEICGNYNEANKKASSRWFFIHIVSNNFWIVFCGVFILICLYTGLCLRVFFFLSVSVMPFVVLFVIFVMLVFPSLCTDLGCSCASQQLAIKANGWIIKHGWPRLHIWKCSDKFFGK